MVGEEFGVDADQLFSAFWKNMPLGLYNQINFIGKLGVILAGISIAYILISLIIKLFQAFFGTEEARRLKHISGQLDEIVSWHKKPKKEDKKDKK